MLGPNAKKLISLVSIKRWESHRLEINFFLGKEKVCEILKKLSLLKKFN
jgi:hypothetical protein